jgi:hypothetical protein
VSSELKPLSISNIGGDNRDETQEQNVNTIIGYINLANMALHAKFSLLQREIMLKEVEHNKPIVMPEIFTHPISAELEDGTPIPINNERRIIVDGKDLVISLMFPEPFICLPKGDYFTGNFDVSLVYAATPKALVDPHDNIPLTQVYTQALINFAAYKGFAGVSGDADKTNNIYWLRYISECKDIKEQGLIPSDNLGSNVKLDDRGFP